jgi:hypothetical protein
VDKTIERQIISFMNFLWVFKWLKEEEECSRRSIIYMVDKTIGNVEIERQIIYFMNLWVF